MKSKLILVFLLGVLWSCKEKGDCVTTRKTLSYVPVIHSFSEISDSIMVTSAREMQDPGKVCFKDNLLFVNEIRKGVHVIDNTDPANPVFLSFIQIPGNGDIDIYQNRLYADSYADILSFDISDVKNIKEVERAKRVFKSGWFNGRAWSVRDSGLYFGEGTMEYISEEVSCDEPEPVLVADGEPTVSRTSLENFKSSPRFIVQNKYLYAVYDEVLGIFELDKMEKLKSPYSTMIGSINFNISSYKTGLFLTYGGQIWIFDNTTPLIPRMVAPLDSVLICDKIVSQNNIAYVAELVGTICGGNENRLKLYDISNISSPRFMTKFSMEGPRALSIDYPVLYVCEGASGFKVFDVSDATAIDKHLLSHEKDIQANNVVMQGKTIFVTATDGLYQLDATDPKNLRSLSKIPFKKN